MALQRGDSEILWSRRDNCATQLYVAEIYLQRFIPLFRPTTSSNGEGENRALMRDLSTVMPSPYRCDRYKHAAHAVSYARSLFFAGARRARLTTGGTGSRTARVLIAIEAIVRKYKRPRLRNKGRAESR